MRLQRPFCRLPIRFDAAKLREEIEAVPASAWSAHPSGYAGNSALRLITAHGGANDDVTGPMRPTAALQACPYLQQVLGSFGVVWSRSRLMKLGAGGKVPQHSDVDYHWYYRVRIHIPVITFPEVKFHCGGQTVHMAAGESWIFDNWRQHSVDNDASQDRIHLVADTMGNERFWDLAARGQWDHFDRPATTPLLRYNPGIATSLLTERHNQSPVMLPAEVEALARSIAADFAMQTDTPASRQAIERWSAILSGFCAEWRQVWSLYGDSLEGRPHFAELRNALRQHLAGSIEPTVYLRSNGVTAHSAVRSGILLYLLADAKGSRDDEVETWAQRAPSPAPRKVPAVAAIHRPVFIVSAPRSGSTLLFETLAESRELYSLGGEAHSLVEQFDALRPGGGKVDSNRLLAADLMPDIAARMRETIAGLLVDSTGSAPQGAAPIRLLEKTPKNSLRIPFFRALFPDALFVYLWRDPRENLSSIMEAWRSGRFVTYRQLDGSTEPWSLLLPPGWQQQRGRPLEEVAAFQWRSANEIVMGDLAALPRGDWMSVNYSEFMADPSREVQRICAFAGLAFDEGLRERVSKPLPPSRHTQTAPAEGKWRKNETEILRVLPGVQPMWDRLRSLQGASP